MNILISWIISALAILAAAYILPGVQVQSLVTALVLAVVLGVINAFLKPILVILTLPLNILTLGLFILVINAVLVMLAGIIVPGFAVANFWWALL
ncbi:phage holin family protein, partial [Candidatus Daviesbacteria bacterium]|nr:phage holin family protein [Candidatus Daviesbacteria bacterium]